MEYKIAICDDREADRNYIAALTREWASTKGHAVELFDFPSAESFLFRYEEDKRFDILLLDIEMGGMDGVTMAKTLRREDETLQIVFVTGYSDYISEGYDVGALHYLMKPVKREKFFEVLNRAADRLRKAERILTLECGGETVRVSLSRVRYADVRLNYVTVHADADFTVKMTLSELTSLLDERFFRVGRSAIVNLTLISRVTKTDILLRDGTAIPLPRGGYEAVNRAIIDMEGTHGTI